MDVLKHNGKPYFPKFPSSEFVCRLNPVPRFNLENENIEVKVSRETFRSNLEGL